MSGTVKYQVVGTLLDGDPEPSVIATFDDWEKAEQCARFLRGGGKYRQVEVRPELRDAADTALSDAEVLGSFPQAGLAEPEHELGEVLFERRHTVINRVLVSLSLCPFALFLAFLATAWGLYVLGILAPQQGPAPPWWSVLIPLGLAGLFATAEWHYLRVRFRCHKFGVSKRGGFGTRRLRYEQIERIKYKAEETRLFYVIPIVRDLTMKFMPEPDQGLKKIVFHSNCWQAEDLLQEITEIVQEHSQERIPLDQY